MINIYYFTGSGHSLKLAEHFGRIFNRPVWDISNTEMKCKDTDTAVIVFPVYCQNIPEPVKSFLRKLSAKHFVLIATYGRFSYGNVLWEAAGLVKGTVIAGAYVPVGHSYLNESDVPFDEKDYLSIFERLKAPCKAAIPKSFKNPLADFFPEWRSRVGVKIRRTKNCKDCGLCNNNCPMKTMDCGVPGKQCVRCLRCFTNCPENALRVTYNPFLKLYLKGKRKNEFVIYL